MSYAITTIDSDALRIAAGIGMVRRDAVLGLAGIPSTSACPNAPSQAQDRVGRFTFL